MLVDQLRVVWSKYPTQRLGQLIVNLCDPLFYVEDHALSKKILDVCSFQVNEAAATAAFFVRRGDTGRLLGFRCPVPKSCPQA